MRNIYFSLLALGQLALGRPTIPHNVERRQSPGIPQYVLDHAPLCWLDTNEAYFPSDLSSFISHTHPTVNTTPLNTAPSPLTIANIDSLNAYGNGGVNTYLTSYEGINASPQPSWWSGIKPDATTHSAPGSFIIIVPKPNGIVDAFYFFFYRYNLGNSVFDISSLEFGDHVGDWEHTMIRFVNSVPQTMYFSQHASGEAFSWSALEKDSTSNRPINYVAKGTHANYAIPGGHDHTIPQLNLPAGALTDRTSRGTLWDPLSQPMTFVYDVGSGTFTSPSGDPTAWLQWKGHWGDPQLADSASGQKDLFGERKYVAGPTGPKDKNLARSDVCEADPCFVRVILTP